MVQMGAGRARITPAIGTRLAGYPTRLEGADRVLDELFVRAFVIGSGAARVCIVTTDVMAVDGQFVAELRRELSERFQLSPDHVLVSATHTHSSSAGLLSYADAHGSRIAALFGEGAGEPDGALVTELHARTVEAVGAAVRGAAPVSVGMARPRPTGIASNRVDPARDAEDDGTVLVFRSTAGEPVGALVHYACHPTTLGAGDRGISADFPGLTCAALERALGPQAVVGYLNGALGDISTRYTRHGFGHEEAQRFAGILTEACLGAIDSIGSWTAEIEPWASQSTVELSVRRPVPTDPQAVADLEAELAAALAGNAGATRQRELEIALQGASLARAWEQLADGPETVDCTIQRLSLAPVVEFVGIPGEPFSWIGRQISSRSTGTATLVVAPANGYLGYLPDAPTYAIAPYETNASLVDQNAADLIVESALDLLAARTGHLDRDGSDM
jgi:hypothetical protein